MLTPRFNLRNASLFLSKLKNKYNVNKSEQNRDNTFIDQQEQISSSNPSMSKKCSQKLDSVTDRLFENQQDEDIAVKSSSPQHLSQKKQQGNSVNIRQTFQTTQQSQAKQHQTEFCDLIVIKYLQETLTIYKEDLQTLQHNRQNLQQEIYFLGKKIGKLHQMSAENQKLQQQISELNEELKQTIVKYHESNKVVWRQKIQMSKIFNKQRGKLKKWLLLQKQDTKNDTENFFKLNSFTQGSIQKYQEFIEFKNQQSKQISQRLSLDKENQSILNKENDQLIQKVFKGKDEIYIRDHKQKQKNTKSEQRLQPPPSIKENGDRKKEKKVVLYDESEFKVPQQTHKQKPKKLSQAQRASLLGDLKNFSKSFKLPK